MLFAAFLPVLAILVAPILAQPLAGRQYTDGAASQAQAGAVASAASCGRGRGGRNRYRLGNKYKHKNGTASASGTAVPAVPVVVPIESAVATSASSSSSSSASTEAAAPSVPVEAPVSEEASPTVTSTVEATTAPSSATSEATTSTPGNVLIVTQPTTAPASTSSPVSQPEQPNTDANAPAGDSQTLLQLHNDFRAKYGAGALSWNATLAKFASEHGSKCQFKHSGGPYGENLAAGAGGGYTAASGFNAWAGEASKYDWNAPGFSSGTGHFTQIVWKATTQLGCAVIKCKDGTIFSDMGGMQSTFLVCEYLKPGNMVGNNGQYFRDNVGTLQG